MQFDLIIGGDLVPTKSNERQFSSGDIGSLIDKDLEEIITSADYRIINLETPLTDQKDPIVKEGPKLSAKTTTINGIKALKTDLVTLANNHILDQNEQGLRSTINTLNQNNIFYVGGGFNLSEACKPYIIEKNDIKIGVYACTEHEYTIASDTSGGANPFEPLDSLDHIIELSSKCDYTLVLYHGGKELYRYPTPYLQKVCRKIIDKGANLVICQHSHCIGSFENFKNGTIIYGQGNFIFDWDKPFNHKYIQTSLLIKLKFDENVSISYIPIRKVKNRIKLAEDEDGKEILKAFYERSEQIKEKDFIIHKFNELVLQKGSRYLLRFSKVGNVLSSIDKRLLKGKVFDRPFGCLYMQKQKLTIHNSMQCEVHRELLLRYLQLAINRKHRKGGYNNN